MPADDLSFAAFLRDQREIHGLTLREAGARIGCTKTHILDLEAGRSHNPKIMTLVALARAYRLDVGDLARRAAATCAPGVRR